MLELCGDRDGTPLAASRGVILARTGESYCHHVAQETNPGFMHCFHRLWGLGMA